MYFYSKGELPETIEKRAASRAGSRLAVLGVTLGNVLTFGQLLPQLDVIAEDLRTFALFKNQGSIADAEFDYSSGSIQTMPLWGSCETALGQITVGLSDCEIAMQSVPGPITGPKSLLERPIWELRLPLGMPLTGAGQQECLPEVRYFNSPVPGGETLYAPHAIVDSDEALTARCFVQGVKVMATGLNKVHVQTGEKE